VASARVAAPRTAQKPTTSESKKESAPLSPEAVCLPQSKKRPALAAEVEPVAAPNPGRPNGQPVAEPETPKPQPTAVRGPLSAAPAASPL